jgi:hypothetical protein
MLTLFVVVNLLGYSTPFAIFGHALAAIGGGLTTTFSPSTSTGAWVGYQILTGYGRGISVQQPILAVQHTLPLSQMSVGTAVLVFAQFFGGALFLAFADADFANSLGPALHKYAPGVNETMIVVVGAAGLRDAVTSQQLPGVLMAYNEAIMHTLVSSSCLISDDSIHLC